MRSIPVPFLRIRLGAIFLVSLGAVYGATLAWRPAQLARPSELAWPPLLLGIAAVAGAVLYERLAWIAERVGRGRVRAVLGTVYGTFVFIVFLAIMAGNREALDVALRVLQLMQAAFLLIAGLGRAYLSTLLNAVVLTVVASLAGGVGATAAATAVGATVPFFLVADRAARTLSAYPSGDGARTGFVWREAFLATAGVAAVILAIGLTFPTNPYAPLERAGAVPTIARERLAGIVANAVAVAVGAAGVFFLLLRFGTGRMRETAGLTVEVVAARRKPEPPAATRNREAEPGLDGWRGRVIRVYFRMAEQLARWGVRRRPDQTVAEFSDRLDPSASARELADLFNRARYGGVEVGEAEHLRAEAAARDILDRRKKR